MSFTRSLRNPKSPSRVPLMRQRGSSRRLLTLERLEDRLCLSTIGLDTPLTTPKAAVQARLSEAYGQLPLSFEANQGQTDAQVNFLSRGSGYGLYLTPTAAVLALNQGSGVGIQASTADVLRMQLISGNPAVRAVGLDAQAGTSNYLIGSDPSQWLANITNFGRVEYQNVYRGVDLIYYGSQRQLEYDFVVAPGADTSSIQLAFQGAESMTLDAQGDLVLHAAGGDVVEHAPVLYQDAGGIRQAVSGHFALGADGQVGFAVGAYDTTKPLVIDPTLSYSTYLGGGGVDAGIGIAVDAAGNAYVTGITTSADFPIENPLQPANAGGNSDVFVAKLNAAGSALVYSTYLGGVSDDVGRAIAVDAAGNAYVTGFTESTDFPTENPLQPANGGGIADAFVAKLNAAGSALVYSTYLGGGAEDTGEAIAVDAAGDAYVTGFTFSTDFPTESPLQPADGSELDAFVAKLNPTGSALVYSTYLGGNGDDLSYGVALDAAGDAYVAGVTESTDFPTENPLQPANGGGNQDAFVAKLNPTGSALVYSTYLGGNGFDEGQAIAVDAAGDAYVTGFTESTDFPTENPLQPANGGGGNDTFVVKLNPTGSALVYSTYLGGNGVDKGQGIAVDAAGNADVTGITASTDFPTETPLQSAFGGGPSDAFVVRLNTAGSALVYSTYLGGNGDDGGQGIAVDSAGNVYVTGSAISTDFPTEHASQPANGGGYDDGFIAKIAPNQATTTLLSSSPNPSTVGQTVTFTATVTVPQGAGVASGTIAFLEGTVALGMGTLNGDGLATFSTTALAAGDHIITAAYDGDNSFAVSSSNPVDETIDAPALTATTTALTASPTSAGLGQPVTFTAIVASSAQALATGDATFTLDGVAQAPSALSIVNGQDAATLTLDALTTGNHVVTAVYDGDGSFAASSSNAVNVTINAPVPTPTTTTLTASPTSADLGQPVTFTAIVASSGESLATGGVTFSIDGAAQSARGLSVINGRDVATLTLNSLVQGAHVVTAAYGGSAAFLASASGPASLLITGPAVPADGPLVMNLQRFGYHAQPTVVVLTFSEDLDPTTAGNAANYKIVPVGPHGKFGHSIAIARVDYNPAAWTVTLHPTQRLNVHKRFELIVDGTSRHAVVDLALHALDGGNTGKTGSDYHGAIDWAAIAGPSLPGKQYAKAWRKLVASGAVGQSTPAK
jgi:Bacterial Ig-like domain (group 3)/Beta-propeller repeat